MTKALARFAVVDSRRWIRFAGASAKLDNTDFCDSITSKKRMLQMFYVTLSGQNCRKLGG